MLDNDNLTYKKSLIGDAVDTQAERVLITPERSQKLDLLIHLLANLRQALVVCGPEGIGKTTLLQTLRERRKDQWRICLLQGSSALSFETVINDLNHCLNLGASSGFDLSSLRAYCEKQKVVLIIDNAGKLVPGLIGELVDFADSLSGLRLVFSMTYDEFHIKSASDKAVDDCHFIELPPLNKKQCAEYLQNLSAQPGAILPFNAITDSLVDKLYRETHGIPGRILAEIPKLNQYQSRKKGRLGLWLGVALIVSATGWIAKDLLPTAPTGDMPSVSPPAETEPLPVRPAIIPNIADTVAIVPSLELPAPATTLDRNPIPQAEKTEPDIAPTPIPEQPAVQTASALEQAADNTEAGAPNPVTAEQGATPTLQTTQPTADEPQTEASTDTGLTAPEVKPSEAPEETLNDVPEQKPAKSANDIDWIMAQPANNYTIQIMVLSSKDSVTRFLKKYAEYRDSLKYFTIKQNDREKYVLIYGSFQSSTDARQHKTTMPKEFINGLEKRFKSIQYQIRR